MALLRSAATISAFTLLSRITGLIRDVIIARTFGAGPLTDAFWVAFRIPNLLRRLFAEGAFSQAFVPILGEVRTRAGEDEVRSVLDRVATMLTVAVMGVTALGVLLAPWVVGVMASGLLSADRHNEFDAAVRMTRVMFPYIICMSLIAFASGVLNTWSRFAVPAFTPILLNLSMIGASLFLISWFEVPIYALSIGVMAGGVLQLAVQLAALHRLGLLPRPVANLAAVWRDAIVRKVLRKMLPAILGVSVAQISLLINTNIATWLQPGSVTWLSFADRLMEFPTALLGVALGTVLLPSLSRAYASDNHKTYNELIDWGLRLIVLLGLPATLGLALLADGMVATLFHYGAFLASDVNQTRLAVMAYSVGLMGLLAIKILAPAFYARQDIRTPVKIAAVSLVATQVCNAVFVPSLAHAGLALSIGLGAILNATLLATTLYKRGIYSPCPGWTGVLIRSVPALLVLGGMLIVADQRLDWIDMGTHPFLRVLTLGGVLLSAVLAYFAMLALCGFRPADFTRRPK